MKIFLINGISLAGKDSFVNRVCVADYTYSKYLVKCISTIDPVKKIYREFFGWNGEKSPVHRKNLNILKRIWIETSNGPLEWTKLQINYSKKYTKILFIMVREFSEMQSTKKLATDMGFEAYTLAVIRPGIDVPPIEQEFLDSHPKGYKYDIVVLNPTTETFPNLPLLDEAAENFIKTYM